MMLRRLVYGCGLLVVPMFLCAGCDRSNTGSPKPDDASAARESEARTLAATERPNENQRDDQPENTDGNNGVLATHPAASGNRITSPELNDQTELLNRPFAKLQPKETDDPDELLAHIREIDAALQDLVLAGSSNLMDEATFTEGGLRLGRMKRAAGQRLTNAPAATEEQRKSGMIAQLVALSHMSGLRDVPAAKELERYAGELAASSDPDLAHQSRIVLLGFELQSLQNGVHDQPDALLAQIAGLFQRPQDRSFPEFMVLQQAQQVLSQLGFAEAANQVRQILVAEYRDSTDPQLRGESWLMETQESQAYHNFVNSFRDLGSAQFDSQAAIAAVRGLYQAFPSPQTIEQLANTVSNIEYAGQLELSRDMVSFIEAALNDLPDADTSSIDQILSDHRARVSLLNNPWELTDIVGFDGSAFQWSDYRGKVVLVDFWASWCIPCLREIPTIREVHSALGPDGFEVISVNMDENLAEAEDFVQKQAFPWRTYHAADTHALGFRAAFVRRLGISAIPFMVLIDRDGNVAAIHVRGDKLRPAVENLLAQPPSPQ